MSSFWLLFLSLPDTNLGEIERGETTDIENEGEVDGKGKKDSSILGRFVTVLLLDVLSALLLDVLRSNPESISTFSLRHQLKLINRSLLKNSMTPLQMKNFSQNFFFLLKFKLNVKI